MFVDARVMTTTAKGKTVTPRVPEAALLLPWIGGSQQLAEVGLPREDAEGVMEDEIQLCVACEQAEWLEEVRMRQR